MPASFSPALPHLPVSPVTLRAAHGLIFAIIAHITDLKIENGNVDAITHILYALAEEVTDASSDQEIWY
jgi:hypothetical protein